MLPCIAGPPPERIVGPGLAGSLKPGGRLPAHGHGHGFASRLLEPFPGLTTRTSLSVPINMSYAPRSVTCIVTIHDSTMSCPSQRRNHEARSTPSPRDWSGPEHVREPTVTPGGLWQWGRLGNEVSRRGAVGRGTLRRRVRKWQRADGTRGNDFHTTHSARRLPPAAPGSMERVRHVTWGRVCPHTCSSGKAGARSRVVMSGPYGGPCPQARPNTGVTASVHQGHSASPQAPLLATRFRARASALCCLLSTALGAWQKVRKGK